MTPTDQITFIVQAREGSSRLPGKILLPFDGEQSILELLIDKLLSFDHCRVIIATSIAPANDAIQAVAERKGVSCYRGSEDDVLQRFIDAAQAYDAHRIIRVCSDNPFLERQSIDALRTYALHTECDYIAFDIFGRPSIQTHYGFWTEYVTRQALERVATLTQEKLYREHVTNYIYTHAEHFDIHWLKGPEALRGHEDIRLTIDTADDFRVAQEVYQALTRHTPYPSIPQVVAFLDSHPQYYASMRNQIIKNSK